MPVTLRSLQIRQVNGAGKKGPTNLKYDHEKKRVLNLSCDCIPPVTKNYTVAGSYTDTLPVLRNGFAWQISGTVIAGGGGGGGGGGGVFAFEFRPGGRGRSSNVISSLPISTIFPSGAVIVSTVGAGGAGGVGAVIGSPGLNGLPGNLSSLTHNTTIFSTPGFAGGIGGVVLDIEGNSTGELGGTAPGSVGSGGNGRTTSGGDALPGLRGVDGSVSFTATVIRV